MATFKDRKEGSWDVEILRSHLPKLREAGFDLNAIRSGEEFARKLTDPDTFGAVIVILCSAQMRDRGITEEGFAELFNGPTVWRAIRAIEGAIADFTQPPTVAAEFNRELPATRDRLEKQLAERVRTTLAGLNLSVIDSPESAASAPEG